MAKLLKRLRRPIHIFNLANNNRNDVADSSQTLCVFCNVSFKLCHYKTVNSRVIETLTHRFVSFVS